MNCNTTHYRANSSSVPGDPTHPLLALYTQGEPVTRRLDNTYFDTPDLLLRRHDCGLRVRRAGGRAVQTLKGGGSAAGGLHMREEWETPLAGDAPDLAALREAMPAGPWRKLMARDDLAALEAIFTTDFMRTAWQLRSANGDEVELALDLGRIVHGADEVAISEIELELKSGDPACLFELALALQRDLPLTLANASKAQRGYALFQPRAARVADAAPLQLDARMRAANAWLAVVADCVARLQGNEAAVATGIDPEAVHQMHVALRRVRAACAVFGCSLSAELSDGLDWLSRTLGDARDWHLFADVTLMEVLCAQPDQRELAQLRLAAGEIARQRRVDAAEAIASPRYTRLLLTLAHAAHLHAHDPALAHKLKRFAARRLRELSEKLVRRGGRAGGTDPASWHRVRIAAKQLRYAMEFFAQLNDTKAYGKQLRRLKTLQEKLGALNDVATALQLLDESGRLHAGFSHGAGFVGGYLAAQLAQAAQAASSGWQSYADTPYRF